MTDTPSSGDGRSADAATLEELRSLLLSSERAAIREILERLDDSELRAAEVSEIVAEAVARASGSSDDLARALAPTVESSLQVSIRRNPKPLVDAISPIMGPAIRRSILQAIGGMVQSVNRTVEQSFSVQGLKWRIEAARSGQSFGEVVALKTLSFQVEQVFLIHRETGLLLAHRSVWPSTDPDLVGSMLVAIRDFVSDSFDDGGNSGGTLDTVQIGDRTLWVETGRDAILAGLVRGSAPSDLRDTLVETLEEIEMVYGEQLAAYEGDDEGLGEADVYLGQCLLSQGRESEKEKSGPSRGAVAGWSIAGLIVLLVIGLNIRDRVAFADAVGVVRAEPGWVLVDASRGWGGWRFEVLRDPIAASPDSLRAMWPDAAPGDAAIQLRRYESADSAVVVRRAHAHFDDAGDAVFELLGSTLRVQGTLSPGVWDRVQREGPLLTGVDRVELAGTLARPAGWTELVSRIEEATVGFPIGSTIPRGPAVDSVLVDLRELDRMAARSPDPVVVRLIGSADPTTGSPATNERLARARAQALVERFGQGWARLQFEVLGVVAPEVDPTDPDQVRAVRLEVRDPVR